MRFPSMCFFCEHNKYSREEIKKGLYNRDFDWDKVMLSCDAYPNGITGGVFNSGHLYPKLNDNGIQFSGDNPFSFDTTQEDEDASYEFASEYIDRENMTDEKYMAKYGKERPTVRIFD